MSIHLKTLRRTAVGFATGALVLAGATLSPAHAANTWELGYNDGTLAAPGDIITNVNTASLPTKLKFSGLYNGAPASIDCSIATGQLSYTVPSPRPSAAPGGTISVGITPPATITSCIESVSMNSVTVYNQPGVAWTLNVTVPSGTTPSPWASTLTGSIHIPQNSMVVRSNFLADVTGNPPCVIQGPADAGGLTVNGQYNAAPSAGTATPTSPLPQFQIIDTVTPATAPWYTATPFNQCPVTATGTFRPQLQSATVSLRKGTKTPTVVYVP
ncbi:hypothetical protein [Nocardioides sp. BYT-33-1]|uniref:hypothetical protein n=1 Tax=Nocardioides sp. BYT-33-1 TaxID=3416952 RepID=UPI003F537DD3